MNSKQTKQVNLQIKVHRHKRYKTNIVLGKGSMLRNFVVEPGVLRPEIMTSMYLAKWLFSNRKVYKNKIVLDLGSGTGIIGVIAGKFGAKRVVSSDIDPIAVNNTRQNIKNAKLASITSVVESDLFKKIKSKFDVVIFNHPFFGNVRDEYAKLDVINNGGLLKKFLKEVKSHLKSKGIIIMPYFHLAGPKNDPGIQAPKQGYKVKIRLFLKAASGIQKGPTSIYELSLK